MNGVRRGRTRLFALILTAWAAVVVARLVQIQIAQGSRYRARAARQQERRIEIAASRGSILDREGRELAVSVEASSIYAIPDDVQKPRAVAQALAPLVGMPAGRDPREARLREGVRLDPAPDRCGRGREDPRAEAAGHSFRRGAQALLPEGPPRLRGARVRRHRRRRPGRPRAPLRQGHPRQAGRDGRADGRAPQPLRRGGDREQPAGAGGLVARALARLGRAVRGRARARRGDGGAPREVGQRGRARSLERRDPRDGLRAGLRPERLRALPGRVAAQPRHRRLLRAGLHLQDRDGGAGRGGGRRLARRDHRHRRRDDPRGEHDDPGGEGAPLRRADARRHLRALLQHRHHPRRPSPRPAAAVRGRAQLRRRASPPGSTCRARTPGSSGRCRGGPPSPMPRSRWARKCP